MQNSELILKPFIDNSAYLNRRIAEGVEARKKWCRLNFVGADGKPVENARARVTLKKHDFHYGANLFLLDEFKTDAENDAYKAEFAKTFNFATLPFYWCDLEPERGKPRYAKDSRKIYRRPAPELCLDWCESAGVTPKAHVLVYDSYRPKWLPDDVTEQKKYYAKRFRELSERFGGRIHGWEVINETLCWGGRPEDSSFFSQPDLLDWSFRRARDFFPDNELILNEASELAWSDIHKTRNQYYMLAERLIEHGLPLDTIGMQFHMFYSEKDYASKSAPMYDPWHMYEIMDTFSRLGKPMQVTEITIPCFTHEASDEDLQAEVIKNIYSMWFSCPAMEAVVYWNLVDDTAFVSPANPSWNENTFCGGLVRRDFSEKPAVKVIQELFTKKFTTDEVAETDGLGRNIFKGFCGEYEAEVSTPDGVRKASFRLSNTSQSDITVVI